MKVAWCHLDTFTRRHFFPMLRMKRAGSFLISHFIVYMKINYVVGQKVNGVSIRIERSTLDAQRLSRANVYSNH